jgi:hypothetical protein
MPERGCHALALDGDKHQIDSLTSNIGHLLWSGLLDEIEAAATADRLLQSELYSGWGVRTLGDREAGYNPLGYHTGTVWPHENSLIVAGLARYGHHEQAVTIAAAMLAAAPHFEHRLPEVFAGYPAAVTSVPVAYPTASRPQAWAAGTATTLLQLHSHKSTTRTWPHHTATERKIGNDMDTASPGPTPSLRWHRDRAPRDTRRGQTLDGDPRVDRRPRWRPRRYAPNPAEQRCAQPEPGCRGRTPGRSGATLHPAGAGV